MRFTRFRHHFRAANEKPRVDAQCPTDESQYDHGADPEPAAAARQAAKAAAPIFNSVALRQLVQAQIQLMMDMRVPPVAR